MEIALYVRVSTSRQQQAQTIDQQLDRLRTHVALGQSHHSQSHTEVEGRASVHVFPASSSDQPAARQVFVITTNSARPTQQLNTRLFYRYIGSISIDISVLSLTHTHVSAL